ncbi:MAG TPA: sugar ABC transporter permease [Actinocrinis sp.]|uniref:carbohydrate ABC transporter permease n=1 Tax=Actinocrinis sp. TaxID=1920516 RepID=UPI002DDD6C69|nr:sugar ABC transporter permease [Actinocrinis sp.]HEV3168982.1 sugar ABC transporter permease [Actinocrinis sp.]
MTVLTTAPRKVALSPPRHGRRGADWLKRLPLLPAVIFTVVVTQIPFVLTLWYSFQKYSLNYPNRPRQFPTVANYTAVFSDPVFRTAALNTVLFTAVPVICSVLLGLGIAILLNRRVFGRGLLRTLIISPFLVMSAAAALVWKYSILDTTFGVLNYVLKPFGVHDVNWIGTHSQLTIITFLTWQWTPFMVLIILAGLQSQNEEMLEAARVDGAGPWRIFRALTLPHLRTYLELGILLGSIYIVQAFDSIFLITQGGPATDTTNLPYYIYQVAFQAYDIGRASAMSVVVVVATILIATMALRTISSIFSDEGMSRG